MILDDGDEVAMGCDSSQMQCNMALIKDLADSCPAVTILFRDIGFGKDDPTGSVLNPMGRLSMKQNVTELMRSGMI
jgi:hypothetical protein